MIICSLVIIQYQFCILRSQNLLAKFYKQKTAGNYLQKNRIQKMQEQTRNLTKIQLQLEFSKMFDDIHNSSCFNCGKQCKQWVETRHAIFLCLSCATKFKEAARPVNIKSVSLDCWNQAELQMLKRGGNCRFKEFLSWYDLQFESPQVYLRSKASQFYRIFLLNPERLELSDAPSINEGKVIQNAEVPLQEITSNELLQQASTKLSQARQATLYYGNMAYEKIHHKLETGEYKDDAKKAAQKVTETVKNIWSFVSSKLDEIKSTQNKQNKAQEPQVLV